MAADGHAMSEAQTALPFPQPAEWTRPRGKQACGRDPAAGPGTCWHWWEGCPRAEKRGCYLLWAREQRRREQSEASHG